VGKASANALVGKRVVVTRAAEQSEALFNALCEGGAVPVFLPMLMFAPPDDFTQLDQAIGNLADTDWVFLTSQNALRALEQRCRHLRVSLAERLSQVRIAAVGPATAEAAESAGLRVSYIAKKHRGVALAEELAGELNNKSVLLPRSDRANRALVEALSNLGARVVEVVAYRTLRPDGDEAQHRQRLLRERVDAVLFFSPSAVRHLQEFLGAEEFCELSRKSAFAAVGPVTMRALQEAGAAGAILAQDTTVNSILEALASFFSHIEQAGAKRA
jgi:uroporphyrinogen-III synthase